MKDKIILSKYINKVFETPSKEGSEWFGYYNYDTLNGDQTKLLANRSKVDGVAPQKGITIELGYYEIATGEWQKIGESDSWNWQQGAMMQWLPDDSIIYNTSENDHLVAKIYDIKTKETRTIDWAIYGITPDGKKSITLDLERSYWCRAYHYQSVANPDVDGAVVESDGIFEIDLINNTRKRIISIHDVIKAEYQPYFDDCKHWIEHIMISKNGKYFCFLHRFSPIADVYKYETRICIANIDGSNLHVMPNWKKFEWSHFGWCVDDAFSIYTVQTNAMTNKFKAADRSETKAASGFNIKGTIVKCLTFAKNMLPPSVRRMIKGQANYYQYYTCDSNGIFSLSSDIRLKMFNIDGHPSFTNNGRYMITDSYPDSKQYQHLMVYDTHTHKGLVLADLYAYYHGNPASCDLHPKLCANNKYIVVDTAYDEKHHMIVLELDWDLIKSKIS